jgi:hypothetical protein
MADDVYEASTGRKQYWLTDKTPLKPYVDDGAAPVMPEGVGDWNPMKDFAMKFAVRPPVVPVNGEQGGSVPVRVNTEALAYFAQVLQVLSAYLDNTKKQIDGIVLAPGSFREADELNIKVTGGEAGTSIKATTSKFIGDAMGAIVSIVACLRQMVSEYDTVEEMNKMNGKQLLTSFEGAQGPLMQAVGGPVTPSAVSTT